MAQKLCPEFYELTPIQRIQFIGSLNHIVMTSPEMYELGNKMINLALLQGLLNDVKILPEQQNDNHE
jgi:hypothetical protein